MHMTGVQLREMAGLAVFIFLLRFYLLLNNIAEAGATEDPSSPNLFF